MSLRVRVVSRVVPSFDPRHETLEKFNSTTDPYRYRETSFSRDKECFVSKDLRLNEIGTR